jgi:hypothetical protein
MTSRVRLTKPSERRLGPFTFGNLTHSKWTRGIERAAIPEPPLGRMRGERPALESDAKNGHESAGHALGLAANHPFKA